MREELLEARCRGDQRPSLAVIAACLDELGVTLPERRVPTISLTQAREEWLSRLRSSNRSASTLTGYRIALDDLLAFFDRSGSADRSVSEETIVAYLNDY